jgi:aryl-alcohol dehydrogenase-like predicted oxidoreductase
MRRVASGWEWARGVVAGRLRAMGAKQSRDPAGSPLAPGRATPAGTARYAARFASQPGHFRRPDRLSMSSLGLGTRPGEPGGVDDLAYRSSLDRAVELGINVVDTSISYRMQSSERNVGAALARAIREGRASRDEIVVVTKGGYLTVDPLLVRTRADIQRYLITTYVESGLVDVDGLVNGSHCLDAPFLRDQIERSRRNLGLATIDLYMIEDPELHLLGKGPTVFRQKLCEAVEVLEEAVARDHIASYGFSTWSGLFVPYTEKGHLAVADLFEVALDVGGSDNHFRGISFPFSVAMGEAVGLPSQFGGGARPAGVLDMLEGTGVAALTSAPLVRGRAVHARFSEPLREALAPARTPAQIALQLARSTPGVTTTLCGMRSLDHLEENAAVTHHPPASADVIERLFAEVRAAS